MDVEASQKDMKENWDEMVRRRNEAVELAQAVLLPR